MRRYSWLLSAVLMLSGVRASAQELGSDEAQVGRLKECLELTCEPAQHLLTRGDKAWEALKGGLHHPEELVRFWTIGILSELKLKEAHPIFVSLLKDPTIRIRAASAFALGAYGDKSAVPALSEALFDSDVNVRFEAASALSRLPDGRALKPLIEALEDPDTEVRKVVAEALGLIGDKQAAPPLAARLREEKRPVVRGYLAVALGQLKASEGVVELLARVERERDHEARAAMAWALGECAKPGEAKVLEALTKLSSDKDEKVATHAKEALTKLSSTPK